MRDRPTFDEYFGYMIQVASWRSDDEETQVGCVIADSKNRIVGMGYNGTPRGTNLPKTRPDKYPFMCHSEPNAILSAGRPLDGCKLYVLGMLPCDTCARLICQAGIKEVIIVNQVERTAGKDWNFDATLEMFRQCKIELRYITVKKVQVEVKLKPSDCTCSVDQYGAAVNPECIFHGDKR